MEKDSVIFDLIEREHQRQAKGIELIASENHSPVYLYPSCSSSFLAYRFFSHSLALCLHWPTSDVLIPISMPISRSLIRS